MSAQQRARAAWVPRAVAAGLAFALATLLLAAQRPTVPAAAEAAGMAVVPLDLLVADGRPDTLRLVAGTRYRVDQIDLAATDVRPEDDGLLALMTQSAFAGLDWQDLALAMWDTAHAGDGTPFLRQFFRDARWMTGAHRFTVVARNAAGEPEGSPVVLESEADRPVIANDDFPIRRPVVIREHRGGLYHAEALLQLRNGGAHAPLAEETFLPSATTRSLELTWEAPGLPTPRSYTLPVEIVPDPPFAYGFQFDLVLASPSPSGAYLPGDTVEVVLTFRDGAGTRLHPPGSLPTYNQFLAGLPSGLRYYDFYPSVLFFKDKNKEGVPLVSFQGPDSHVRQIYNEMPAGEFAHEQQVAAIRQRDGFTCVWQMLPPANVLFGGLLDPAIWDTPVSDRMRFAIPGGARAGAYRVVGKARRAYLGESSLATAEVHFKVHELIDSFVGGGAAATPDAAGQVLAGAAPNQHPVPLAADDKTDPGRSWVGRCEECHTADFRLGNLLHGNNDPASCGGCHAPLYFEPDNMLVYRVHYVHNLSRRYNAPLKDCQTCHIAPESVRRTSLMACMSCHRTRHLGGEEFGLYGGCDFPQCHEGVHRF